MWPSQSFLQPSLGFRCSRSIQILTSCPYLDNLEFDIFDAGGLQCHFVTSVTIAVRIRCLSALA